MTTSSSSLVPDTSTIVLEGVRVHNLKNVNVQIRRGCLTVICGVSGSGKSSLAFDTLFAEGQRRYVETFSPYARQFLDRIERPDVDRIEGIPPAIAIRQNARSNSPRSTVGTRTEVLDYLRILFAKAGSVICPDCGVAAVRMTADAAAKFLLQHSAGRRAMLTFPLVQESETLETDLADQLQAWQAAGFSRCIVNNSSVSVQDVLQSPPASSATVRIIADRIRIDEASADRIAESLEQVFSVADGRCDVLIEITTSPDTAETSADSSTVAHAHHASRIEVDGRPWNLLRLSQRLMCVSCGQEFETASPEMLNFQSPLGACTTCEGTGQISGMSFDRIVPDDSLSLRAGAIQPWTTPAYRHELDELLQLASKYQIPVDVPFAELTTAHRQLIHDGIPAEHFGGVAGFHRWLVRNRYKKGVSVFLNRWRSWIACPDCHGNRLTAAAGVIQLHDLTISQACALELQQLQSWIEQVIASLDRDLQAALTSVLQQLTSRLQFLNSSGLNYLALDRSLRTLSGGEGQRVALTAALGSGLINTLYVLDEPTSGLHADDAAKVIAASRKLQQQGNTVVVVEHDPEFICAADEVIEIGPGAGDVGGEVVFHGSPSDLKTANTVTAAALSELSPHTTATHSPTAVRQPSRWLTFAGVHCHNIHDLQGQIPLDLICSVTGVSGSGKSSLIVDALYPAVCRQLGIRCSADADGTVASLSGTEALADVCLLDQSPLQKGSRRSIPATTIGCFDDIRKVLADTHEARKRNYKPGMFSFNSAQGGRCPNCEGHGIVTVEMQFLADIQTTCEACGGKRFRPDVLEVRYRDRNIHDILQMTAEDAFTFFNGHRRIQQRLNAFRQAGLGYIRLGQPVSTLSGGENQRLRIAALLAGVALSDNGTTIEPTRTKPDAAATLFILDEPSTGLHLQDISALMKCLNHLVEIGHSVIIIEHDPQVLKHSDHIITLGPGPGQQGGNIISTTPTHR